MCYTCSDTRRYGRLLRCGYGYRHVVSWLLLVVGTAVRLRATRDELRNGNKRPHSVVSVSSSSSSGSSGFTGASLLGHHQTAAAATTSSVPATHVASTLSTMHESPLELIAATAAPPGRSYTIYLQ